ncbi:hypothetical protein QTP88_009113 [Uroleucon formosanum]
MYKERWRISELDGPKTLMHLPRYRENTDHAGRGMYNIYTTAVAFAPHERFPCNVSNDDCWRFNSRQVHGAQMGLERNSLRTSPHKDRLGGDCLWIYYCHIETSDLRDSQFICVLILCTLNIAFFLLDNSKLLKWENENKDKNKLKAGFRTKYGGLYGETVMRLKDSPFINPFKGPVNQRCVLVLIILFTLSSLSTNASSATIVCEAH